MKEDILKRFLLDTKEHEMTVLRDEGLNRHIRFRKPGTSCYGFDLITWSGHLCYTGDMGTYVFSRIEDMFEFFRTDRREAEGVPQINTGYWAEKVLAADCNGKIREFCWDKFAQVIRERLDGRDASPDLRREVEERILESGFSNEMEARQAVDDFEFEKFRFEDFWEEDLRDYTHLYVWCCYAIAWGIAKYDAAERPAHSGLLEGIHAIASPDFRRLNEHTGRNDRLLHAVLAAYVKHHLGSEEIGWEQLSDILCNALCESMGDVAFCKWLDRVKPDVDPELDR